MGRGSLHLRGGTCALTVLAASPHALGPPPSGSSCRPGVAAPSSPRGPLRVAEARLAGAPEAAPRFLLTDGSGAQPPRRHRQASPCSKSWAAWNWVLFKFAWTVSFIGVFRSFTFKMMIDMVCLVSVMFIALFYLGTFSFFF